MGTPLTQGHLFKYSVAGYLADWIQLHVELTLNLADFNVMGQLQNTCACVHNAMI